jgi:hypothetical protein
MSLTGHTDTCLHSDFSENHLPELPARSVPAKMAALPRWIIRRRAAIEATATMTLAMSAPILAAVATLQTTA